MPAASPVVLLLGAGPNIGQHAAKAFVAKGYKAALTSRKSKDDATEDQVTISSDLSDPNSVVEVFSKVKALLGPPSVVIYNAAAVNATDAKTPLSLPLADFSRSLTINTTSVFVAAQQAVLTFEELPESAAKTFIYTGNLLNTTIMPQIMNLGVGKSATAHMIRCAAAAYADRGFKFYYCDERMAEGGPVYNDIDGEAHGKLFVELAAGKSQGPWQQTFVKGAGYKHFPTSSMLPNRLRHAHEKRLIDWSGNGYISLARVIRKAYLAEDVVQKDAFTALWSDARLPAFHWSDV